MVRVPVAVRVKVRVIDYRTNETHSSKPQIEAEAANNDVPGIYFVYP